MDINIVFCCVCLSILGENASIPVNETCSKEDKMGMKASQIQRDFLKCGLVDPGVKGF